MPGDTETEDASHAGGCRMHEGCDALTCREERPWCQAYTMITQHTHIPTYGCCIKEEEAALTDTHITHGTQ